MKRCGYLLHKAWELDVEFYVVNISVNKYKLALHNVVFHFYVQEIWIEN